MTTRQDIEATCADFAVKHRLEFECVDTYPILEADDDCECVQYGLIADGFRLAFATRYGEVPYECGLKLRSGQEEMAAEQALPRWLETVAKSVAEIRTGERT